HPGLTSAQRHQVGLARHREQVQRCKPPVRQLETREHRIVLAKDGVSSDMQEGRLAAVLDECGPRRGFILQDARIRKQPAKRRDFICDQRRILVRHTDEQWRFFRNFTFFETVLQNRSTGCIRDFEIIDEVFLTIVEGVERKEMECAVRNDRYVAGTDRCGKRCNQTLIQIAKMALRRFENLWRVRSQILRTENELLELKAEPLLKTDDSVRR